jgi:hypothetical protein
MCTNYYKTKGKRCPRHRWENIRIKFKRQGVRMGNGFMKPMTQCCDGTLEQTETKIKTANGRLL